MLPILQAERVTLRPWHKDDAEFVFDMYSQPQVVRYLGRQPTVLSEQSQAMSRIEAWSALAGPVHGIWAIVPNGRQTPVGTALLKLLPASAGSEASGVTEVGWHLHPNAWGHGYATEAGRRLLTHAFSHELAEVFAVTYPENAASQAVCLRLGMTPLGLTDDYYDLTCALFRAEPGRG
jgi:RimJ/RimL family protein N-acetyltransferase